MGYKYFAGKVYRFEMGHELQDSVTPECKQPHGHSYTLEVKLQADKLNKMGMVMDFKSLNEIMEPIIKKYDHNFLTASSYGENPTAENIAKDIFNLVRLALNTHNHVEGTSVSVYHVKLWETANSFVQIKF